MSGARLLSNRNPSPSVGRHSSRSRSCIPKDVCAENPMEINAKILEPQPWQKIHDPFRSNHPIALTDNHWATRDAASNAAGESEEFGEQVSNKTWTLRYENLARKHSGLVRLPAATKLTPLNPPALGLDWGYRVQARSPAFLGCARHQEIPGL